MSYHLIEMLKSSDNNKWDDVALSLRSGLKEQGEKMNQISKSLMLINNYINTNGRPLSQNRDKTFEYIKMICKQKKLSFSETPRNGLSYLELSGDCFRIVVVIQDCRSMLMSPKSDLVKQVLIEYNKEKPTSCPELQKSISEGDYTLLLVHIEELTQLYSVGSDRTQQLKAFLCLQSLEEDINKLSQCPIIIKTQIDRGLLLPLPNNIIGIIKPRSGGIPSQFTFYYPKGAHKSDNSGTDTDRYNVMVQLMHHHENNLLPFIPLVNLQKDSKGNCTPTYVTADSLKCVSLSAKFVLKLSQSLVLSDTNMLYIRSITGLDLIFAGDKCNYVDLLCEQAGSSLTDKDQFYSILPNDKQIVFQILSESAPFNAYVVTSIPFLLPSQLPKIVAILKKQAAVNTMMESFLLTNAKDDFQKDYFGAQQINVSIVSHDELICLFSTSSSNLWKIKFSISFNEYGQSIVKLMSPRRPDNQFIACPQKVIQKYNNLPMTVFWLLYKCGDLALVEPAPFTPDPVATPDQNDLKMDQKESDSLFLKQCVDSARASVNIRTHHKDIYPKILIEPKLELLTAINQQTTVNSPSVAAHHDTSNAPVNKTASQMPGAYDQGFIQGQDNQGLFQNQYLPHPNICHQPGPNSSLNSACAPLSSNNMGCGQSSSSQSSQLMKVEQYSPYVGHGTKHMSLDQMLSSDFAMPFASDGLGSFNPHSHSIHYQDHPNNAPMPNNPFGSHMANFKDSPNPKSARQLDTQSSVLVNLLNCNENSASNNSSLLSRQISTNPPCYPPNAYLSDQLDAQKSIQSQILRGSQIRGMRMPHPNQPPKGALGPNFNNTSSIQSLPISRPVSAGKTDIMMMPYPQDTGSIGGASIRKPRKRRAPSLELNQRLPKMQTPQFPMIQQPIQNDAMHMSNIQMNHPQQSPMSVANQSQSSSNLSFSSPTTMDQSVYDFDDNVEFSKSRTMSSNSSLYPHQSSANNPAALSRRVSGSGSKKPLKVKISRKIIAQNAINSSLESQLTACYDSDMKLKEKAMCRSNTMPNISSILSAPSSTSSVNTVIGITTSTPGTGHSRPTAIMSAIDSPLTCSSVSSMQASPYGSVNIGPQHNLSGTLDNCDSSSTKKRRKRIKLEQGDEAELALKREKLEARKQNRKKKEPGSIAGMSSHSSLENLASLSSDSNLKPPLPIKLSVNTKMGSVTANTKINTKATLSNSCPTLNAGNSSWSNQNISTSKQSSKEAKILAEPILKNYKIPKKKASDNPLFNLPQETNFTAMTAPSKHTSGSITPTESASKTPKDSSEMANSPVEKAASPALLHPDLSIDLNPLTQPMCSSNEQETKLGNENLSNSTGHKMKNIHDVVDRLIAKTSNSSSLNPDSMLVPNTSPPTDPSLKQQDYNPCTENIFDKFLVSKPNTKTDYRQFANSRPTEPPMNTPRYGPYNRPPGDYQPRAPAPPPGSFNYPPRQQFVGSPSLYRMETATPRNLAPLNQAANPYHKKSGNTAQFHSRKKP